MAFESGSQASWKLFFLNVFSLEKGWETGLLRKQNKNPLRVTVGLGSRRRLPQVGGSDPSRLSGV